MSRYYDREKLTHVDGTKIFQNAEDIANENRVAEVVGKVWKCNLIRYASLAAVDWWIERHDRIVGYAELKCRAHMTTKYRTVFLNHRKWLALSLAQLSGQPALFIVAFTDEIRWIRLNHIDPTKIEIRGCKERKWKHTDIEPIIEVPVSDMLTLKGP